MDVVKYVTEYGHNVFGLATGNRAKRAGVYKCKSCGDEMTIWLDHGRFPTCNTCEGSVEWEFVSSEIDDVSQAGRDAKV